MNNTVAMTAANVRRNLRDQNWLILLSLKELLGRLKHIVVRKQSQKKTPDADKSVC